MNEPEPSRRVLLAEDEAIIRLDLKEMLEEEGYEVVAEAGDGQSAVRLADELRPDVVVMDIKMPGLDGLSAAERISGTRIAPVLVLTAFGQRELVTRPLPPEIAEDSALSGAAVMSDGQIALIIDCDAVEAPALAPFVTA